MSLKEQYKESIRQRVSSLKTKQDWKTFGQTKQKKEGTQINTTEDEKGEVSTEFIEIQIITRKYFENLQFKKKTPRKSRSGQISRCMWLIKIKSREYKLLNSTIKNWSINKKRPTKKSPGLVEFTAGN